MRHPAANVDATAATVASCRHCRRLVMVATFGDHLSLVVDPSARDRRILERGIATVQLGLWAAGADLVVDQEWGPAAGTVHRCPPGLDRKALTFHPLPLKPGDLAIPAASYTVPPHLRAILAEWIRRHPRLGAEGIRVHINLCSRPPGLALERDGSRPYYVPLIQGGSIPLHDEREFLHWKLNQALRLLRRGDDY